ncbi:hypothetical protein BJX76DRAFT_328468, partial [Aspergillus varians]
MALFSGRTKEPLTSYITRYSVIMAQSLILGLGASVFRLQSTLCTLHQLSCAEYAV